MHKANSRHVLAETLQLALSSHNMRLASDPPKDAWRHYDVYEKGRAALAAYEAETTKPAPVAAALELLKALLPFLAIEPERWGDARLKQAAIDGRTVVNKYRLTAASAKSVDDQALNDSK